MLKKSGFLKSCKDVIKVSYAEMYFCSLLVNKNLRYSIWIIFFVEQKLEQCVRLYKNGNIVASLAQINWWQTFVRESSDLIIDPEIGGHLNEYLFKIISLKSFIYLLDKYIDFYIYNIGSCYILFLYTSLVYEIDIDFFKKLNNAYKDLMFIKCDYINKCLLGNAFYICDRCKRIINMTYYIDNMIGRYNKLNNDSDMLIRIMCILWMIEFRRIAYFKKSHFMNNLYTLRRYILF